MYPIPLFTNSKIDSANLREVAEQLLKSRLHPRCIGSKYAFVCFQNRTYQGRHSRYMQKLVIGS